jgi:hypothetical protein
MLQEYKNLIPQFKNSPVINGLLDAINNSFGKLDADIAEAFRMLNIDECEREYLDNLGALVGVSRPILYLGERFLKADDFSNPLENADYYVSDAPADEKYMPVADEYYRMVIKAQIFKNNVAVFSVNVLEQLAKILFFQDDISVFYIVKISANILEVHVNENASDETLSFLQSFKIDQLGRKIFDFPWPPSINAIQVAVD